MGEGGNVQAESRPAGALRTCVVHPGTQYVYQTVRAAQEAGWPFRFVTGVYYKPHDFPYNMARLLPRRWRERVVREFRRRNDDALDTRRVSQFPFFSLLEAASGRVPLLHPWRNRCVMLNNRMVSRHSRRYLSEGYDLVHGFSGSALEHFRAAGRAGVVRVLDLPIAHIDLTRRVLEEEARRYPELRASLSYMGQEPGEAHRMRHEIDLAHRVFVGSEFVKESCLDAGIPEQKLWLAPYGGDVASGAASPEPRWGERPGFRALFVGSINARKGAHYLLEAWKRLALPDAELVLVGEWTLPDSFRPHYRGSFRHVPRVPRHEIARYYGQADVFVFPSLLEGSAMVAYEAMAAGLPLIVTPNTGSVVRHGVDGLVVPIRDVAALGSAIRLLYHDRAAAARMGASAQERGREFTWARYRGLVRQGWLNAAGRLAPSPGASGS
jgi:glycosyltransferase involved in cell wall biosynthesis